MRAIRFKKSKLPWWTFFLVPLGVFMLQAPLFITSIIMSIIKEL